METNKNQGFLKQEIPDLFYSKEFIFESKSMFVEKDILSEHDFTAFTVLNADIDSFRRVQYAVALEIIVFHFSF